MVVFVLDAMRVIAISESALSKVIVDDHPILLFWMQLRILDYLNCYEMWVIRTAKDISMKYWSQKSFLFAKSFLELSFVDRRDARYLRATDSTDTLSFRIQTVWNVLSQADFQNLFDNLSRLIATIITSPWWLHQKLISDT